MMMMMMMIRGHSGQVPRHNAIPTTVKLWQLQSQAKLRQNCAQSTHLDPLTLLFKTHAKFKQNLDVLPSGRIHP